MDKINQKYVKALEAAASEGVLIYQGEQPASPQDIAHTIWVREEMAYIPEFIVMDEEGQLKEIWYGNQ
ncbi:MAG: hypothetical protein PUI41_05365 [Lachnospiraceae bacterium]|nr:hypothetical protein [Lachnospiraceae bacterium]MDY3222440.1 hypothetical protein [Lachnospiraceae bacterium]MDY4097758.1 hypothetical protein [Lachnospiraceae bacterium]